MSFEDKKFTRYEVCHALRLCADGGPCEQCEFYEAETPRGYNPCHEYMMLEQAAEYIEGRTAKVIKHKYCLNVVGEQTIGYEWICENCKKMVLDGDDYCSHCGSKLIWEDEMAE